MKLNLHKPIGVFDAGIGSYAVAKLIRDHYPQQDIIYFADRASFPYGAKTKDALAASVLSAIEVLAGIGAVAVVLASNAPSVVVLEDVRHRLPVPVMGIFPPVADALSRSRSGHVAIIGVESLIRSPELKAYVKREAPGGRVDLLNGSPLVDLVESGMFLTKREEAQAAVNGFMADLLRQSPSVDVCTLSSTHLPWLRPYFCRSRPRMEFIDPAEKLLPQIEQHASLGSGRTICIATQSDSYPLSQLKQMFATLGVVIEPTLLTIGQS